MVDEGKTEAQQAEAAPRQYVKDDPENIAGKLKSGQPLNGIGVFVRGGLRLLTHLRSLPTGASPCLPTGFSMAGPMTASEWDFTTTPSAVN